MERKYYPTHSHLTGQLWSDYTKNAVRTEPSAFQLLANLGLLRAGSDIKSLTTHSGHRLERIPKALADLPPGAFEFDWAAFHATGRMLHGTVGLATELVELREAKTAVERGKEAGDICWYTAVLLAGVQLRATYGDEDLALGQSMVGLIDSSFALTAATEADAALALNCALQAFESAIGLNKKVLFYGRATVVDVVVKDLLCGLVHLHRATQLGAFGELCFADILEQNSFKLLGQRYADGGFSNEQATLRADMKKDEDDAGEVVIDSKRNGA